MYRVDREIDPSSHPREWLEVGRGNQSDVNDILSSEHRSPAGHWSEHRVIDLETGNDHTEDWWV